jgi:hypothetical protein
MTLNLQDIDIGLEMNVWQRACTSWFRFLGLGCSESTLLLRVLASNS